MKYIIASDIHGSLCFAKKLYQIIEKENPDTIILLGDVYYHGPRNPLPPEYNPMAVSKLLNNLSNKLICIKGNCDAEVDEMISNFKFYNNYKTTICNKHIMFTHGHKTDFNNINSNIDILFYGHYHTGHIKKQQTPILVNPGSISIPKENTVNSFVLIDNNTIYLKDLNNNNIIDQYNIN